MDYNSLIICIFLDVLGVLIVALVLYMLVYIWHKHVLAHWISKAAFAANHMFDTDSQLLEKKRWVLKFIYDNGFNQGLPDAVVDAMVDEAFNSDDLGMTESDQEELKKILKII